MASVKNNKKNTTEKPSAEQICNWAAYRLPLTVAAVVSFMIFFLATVYNIKYPLFWADESMTMVGAQRVLQFGYPKVHDGKNVWYDLRHSDIKLGIDEKTDAYVGGTGWLHYYYGALIEMFVGSIEDIYTRTGWVRFFFAFIGIAGLVLFAIKLFQHFKNKEQGLLFSAIYFVLLLSSVSLYLHIKEARYYALSIFLQMTLLVIILNMERSFLSSKYYKWISSVILVIVLFLTFHCFAPQYFINIVFFGILIAIKFFESYNQNKNAKIAFFFILPLFSGIIISLLIINTQLGYFKTFEISRAMAAFNGYSDKMYYENLKTVWKFITTFEPGYAVLTSYVLVLVTYKKIQVYNAELLRFSFLAAIFMLVYVFAIARIPNFIYTRYIIVLVPICIAVLTMNVLLISFTYYNSSKSIVYGSVGLILFFWILNIWSNKNYISGRIAEQTNIYKGPLDYTIPFIKYKYKKTDTLIIAANYEETSYMYYLGAKVVIGFVGNNLEQDGMSEPHVLAYRKPWGNYIEYFQRFMQRNAYQRVAFEVYDNPVNNIPELNFIPAFNHKFTSKGMNIEQMPTELYYR